MVSPQTRPKRYTTLNDYFKMVRRLIKTLGTRVGRADVEDLAELIDLHRHLDDAIVVAVQGLRQDGYTWQSIGEATGTTRQAALMKWADRVRV